MWVAHKFSKHLFIIWYDRCYSRLYNRGEGSFFFKPETLWAVEHNIIIMHTITGLWHFQGLCWNLANNITENGSDVCHHMFMTFRQYCTSWFSDNKKVNCECFYSIFSSLLKTGIYQKKIKISWLVECK